MLYNPVRKPNYTPFAKHFKTAKPITDRLVLAPRPTLRNPNPMLRLSFGVMTPKEDMSLQRLHYLMTRGPLQASMIFPDTGVITTALPPQFWDVARNRHLAFTEMTAGELSGWFGYAMHNGYLHSWLPRAIRECLQKQAGEKHPFRTKTVLGEICNRLIPLSVSVADRARVLRFGFEHYVNFLSLRKRLGLAVFRELQSLLGRDPTENELKQKLGRENHQRIAPIAFKGWKDRGKRNYLADEELVVMSVISAVMGGTPTLILTRDNDVFDNFAKLVETMCADYMAYRYAEVHYLNPEGCPMFPMNIPKGQQEMGVLGDTIEHIVLTRKDVEALPPYDFTPVHTFCVLLGNTAMDPKVSTAGFCVETEMSEMLFVKGRASGRNTDRFEGRNMNVGTDLSGPEPGTLFMKAKERYLNYEGVTVSWLDLQHSLKCDPLIEVKRWK